MRLMKNSTRIALLTSCLISLPTTTWAGPLREVASAVGDAAGYVGETVGDTAVAVGKGVSGTAKEIAGTNDLAATRREIDGVAESTLSKVLASNAGANELFEKSYGYAVFDSRKASFLITTGRGVGVAIRKSDGTKTYMHVASAGVNVGAGLQFYQGLFLFETEQSFNRFVNQGWQADATAGATLGKASVEAQAKFTNGMAYYQLSETGIMLDANLTGTKYWKSKELNSLK
jgi:lipid-binding SYLF domain-containing protein